MANSNAFCQPTLCRHRLRVFTNFIHRSNCRLSCYVLSYFFRTLSHVFSFRNGEGRSLIELRVFIRFARPTADDRLIARFNGEFRVPRLVVIRQRHVFSAPRRGTFRLVRIILRAVMIT